MKHLLTIVFIGLVFVAYSQTKLETQDFLTTYSKIWSCTAKNELSFEHDSLMLIKREHDFDYFKLTGLKSITYVFKLDAINRILLDNSYAKCFRITIHTLPNGMFFYFEKADGSTVMLPIEKMEDYYKENGYVGELIFNNDSEHKNKYNRIYKALKHLVELNGGKILEEKF